MNKDLHNIDNVFNDAFQGYEDEPSLGVWDKLNNDLDKKDAERYKERFIGWRRVAIILFLLLSSFVLYEAEIIKTGSGILGKNDGVSRDLIRKDTVQKNISIHDIQRKRGSVRHNQPDTSNDTGIMKNNTGAQDSQQIVFLKKLTRRNSNPINGDNTYRDQYLIIDNAPTKRKSLYNQKTIASPYFKKNNIKADYKLAVATKHREQNSLLIDTSFKLGNHESYFTKLLVKTKGITSVEGPQSFKIMPSRFQANNKISLNIPDSALAKDLVINLPKKDGKKFKPYWTMTGFASNDWGHYQLDNDVVDNNMNQQNEKEEIKRREKHEGSFSTGIYISRHLSKKWELKTGIIYSNTAIVINPQEMYASKKTDGSIAYKFITSSGYGYIKPGFGLPPSVGDSIKSTEAQHNLQAVSLPLMLSYKLGKKKLSITPSAGLSANFISKVTVKTEVTDAQNKQRVNINGLNGMRNVYLGFIADVNLKYDIDRRWSISLYPNFKYAMSPITKSNVVKTFPYSYGLGTGITYKF